MVLSYLGGYGEGTEFYELVCEGSHVLFFYYPVLLGLDERVIDVVSVSMEDVKNVLLDRTAGSKFSFIRHISELATMMLL